VRRFRIAILAAILVIGGVVLGSLWMNLRERKVAEREKEAQEIAREDAKMRLDKIQLVEDKHGRRTWELEARSVEQQEEIDVMMLEDVKVTYYTSDGKTFVVTGKKGRFHQNSRNMELTGDVVLQMSDGYRLKTESVAYDHAQKKVTSPDPVEIEGDQFRLEGRGMLVDMERKIFKILGQVKTRWKRGEKG
jgi:LPS export ABC transporter protein LptC